MNMQHIGVIDHQTVGVMVFVSPHNAQQYVNRRNSGMDTNDAAIGIDVVCIQTTTPTEYSNGCFPFDDDGYSVRYVPKISNGIK